MIDSKLQKAFQYHQRAATCRYVNANVAHIGAAKWAIEAARVDVAAGKTRYPGPVRALHWASESDGLRYVGRVVPEMRRGDVWDSQGRTGWHTDPYGDVFKDGSGLCFGVVYQLPGRNGESRFVAGYEFGGSDGGPTLDLQRVFTEGRGDCPASHCDLDAALDAASYADSMAQTAAENEREYQTAWQAGNRWSDEAETVKDTRRELLALLAERRAVKGAGDYPALCKALRGRVRDMLQTINTARKTMRDLAAGDSKYLCFWPGDKRLQEAFCEAAGLEVMP